MEGLKLRYEDQERAIERLKAELENQRKLNEKYKGQLRELKREKSIKFVEFG